MICVFEPLGLVLQAAWSSDRVGKLPFFTLLATGQWAPLMEPVRCRNTGRGAESHVGRK